MLGEGTLAQLIRFASSGALALMLTLAAATPAAADHGSISGTVTNARDGKPISGVCVKLGERETAPCWTYTNSYGRYLIDLPDAPDGMTWTLRFVHPKYRTVLTEPITVDGPTTYDQRLVRR